MVLCVYHPACCSPSVYIHHSTGLGASHFIRSNGVPVSQYIDDRQVGQLRLLPCFSSDWSDLDLANAAVFISAFVFISCGYFIGIKKSVLIPVQVPFLGFSSDSKKQAFILPEEKKQKFAALGDSVIKMKVIPVKNLPEACWQSSFFFSSRSSR